MLGRGGYGAVYEAEQISMGRTVALKVLLSDIANDPQLVERFNLEARQTSRLRHHNTVTIYDFGRDAERELLFLAMEYLEGRDLKALLKDQGRLSLDLTLHILEQVAASLHEAHELGLVHRDLKPANVMLTRRGDDLHHVKVIDFGIAKVTRDEERRLTETGVLLGTPYYMAPEQLRTGQIDHRVDIYACAVMAFQMLTGSVPFTGANPIEVLSKHALEAPPSLFDVAPALDVPPAVDACIKRAMAKDPEARPATMRDFIATLRRAVVVDGEVTLASPSRDEMPAVRIGSAPLQAHSKETEAALPPAAAPTVASEAVGGEMGASERPRWLLPAVIGGAVALILAVVLIVALSESSDSPRDASAATASGTGADEAGQDELASNDLAAHDEPPNEPTGLEPTDAAPVPDQAPGEREGEPDAPHTEQTAAEETDANPSGETDNAVPPVDSPPDQGASDTGSDDGRSDSELEPILDLPPRETATAEEPVDERSTASSSSTERKRRDRSGSSSSASSSSSSSSSGSSGERIECAVIARPWGDIRYKGQVLPVHGASAVIEARRGQSLKVELLQNGVVVRERSFQVPTSGDCKVTVQAP